MTNAHDDDQKNSGRLEVALYRKVFFDLIAASVYFVFVACLALAIHFFIKETEQYLDEYMVIAMKFVKYYVFAIDILVYLKFVTISGIKLWREI